MMILILGCLPTVDVEAYSWIEEVATPDFFGDNMISPKDMIVFQEGFLVADAGRDALLYVDETESYVLADVTEPRILRSGMSDLLATSDAIYEIDEEGNALLIIDQREQPRAMVHTSEGVFWLEENTLFGLINGELTTLASDLPRPYDMIEWEGAIWITTQEDRAIWSFTIETGMNQILTTDNIPHCFSASADGLWVSTRSFRWPYGGWISFFDGDSLSLLSESPPEAEKLLPYKDGVIWASKQSITYWNADPYQMLVQQVSVGNLLVVDDVLYWSDQQAGRLGRLDISTIAQ